MSEHLASKHGAPSRELIEAYRHFAASGAGLRISGNVMIDGSAIEAHRNVVIEDDRFLPELRDGRRPAGTDASSSFSCRPRPTDNAWHVGGRPATRGGFRLRDATGCRGCWCPVVQASPRARRPEILAVIERFATAARVAATAGFDGVQLHAAHGYLLNQFLSPLVNRREDQLGGSLENRMRLLLEVVRAVHAATPTSFLVAVKLNSADFQRGGIDADDALRVAIALEAEGVHLLEISGGTYESVAVVDGAPRRASTAAREVYFLEFAERFARELTVPIILTGGFRSRDGMLGALRSGAVDIIGMACPLAQERSRVSMAARRTRRRARTVGLKGVETAQQRVYQSRSPELVVAELDRGVDIRSRNIEIPRFRLLRSTGSRAPTRRSDLDRHPTASDGLRAETASRPGRSKR